MKKGTGIDFKDVTSKYALRQSGCILSISRKFDFRPRYLVLGSSWRRKCSQSNGDLKQMLFHAPRTVLK